MSATRRPWWLLINQPAGLVTTVEERSKPGERLFVIRGEPVVQGLAWLTCGPLSALATVALFTGLAITLNLREMSGLGRVLFVAGFLLLPALFWGITVVVANRLSAKPLQAIKDSQTQVCKICLDQKQGRLLYRNPGEANEIRLEYRHIQRVHVTPAIGARDGKSMLLSLETDEGTVVLLNQRLGTHPQKADLAQEIESALQKYAANKKSPLN